MPANGTGNVEEPRVLLFFIHNQIKQPPGKIPEDKKWMALEVLSVIFLIG